jgi:hypothetical protein
MPLLLLALSKREQDVEETPGLDPVGEDFGAIEMSNEASDGYRVLMILNGYLY